MPDDTCDTDRDATLVYGEPERLPRLRLAPLLLLLRNRNIAAVRKQVNDADDWQIDLLLIEAKARIDDLRLVLSVIEDRRNTGEIMTDKINENERNLVHVEPTEKMKEAARQEYNKEINARLIAAAPELAAEVVRLQKRVEELVEALRFYAAGETYGFRHETDVARKALAAKQPEGE